MGEGNMARRLAHNVPDGGGVQGNTGWAPLYLEIKSALAAADGDDLQVVLNALIGELKAQFAAFQRLRIAAELVLDTNDSDEAALKLAKADIKASSDAIGQIVRTLEKVDNLQKNLMEARVMEAETRLDDAAIEAMRDKFLALIEERAREMAEHFILQNGSSEEQGLSSSD